MGERRTLKKTIELNKVDNTTDDNLEGAGTAIPKGIYSLNAYIRKKYKNKGFTSIN